MSDLYWITVLGNLKITSAAFAFTLGLMLLLLIIGYSASSSTDGEEDTFEFCKKYIKRLLLPFIIAILGVIFIPSTKELYLIYGVGGTLNFLKDNPTAKQLPDKCIKAMDKWVDSTMGDNEKKGDENNEGI